MKIPLVILALAMALVSITSAQQYQVDMNPMWKVFCSGVPLYRGRLDSIVTPGKPAGHVHKVFGGDHFSAGVLGQSNLEHYEVTKSASCTSCSIHTIDNSNYWHPELYYQWPNGTYSLVPTGGLTVYYLFRDGDSGIQQTKPNWVPFPKGLRFIAGDPFRRTFNASIVSDTAVSFVCLADFGKPMAPETNGFQTKDHFCKNGFRMQVFFPMCWDGVNLDSPDHRAHMAYPTTRYNGGNCPTTHPVRLPAIFFEAFYSIDKFPHGDGVRQPFVLSNGDPTGYGFHGDFVNGWDSDVMAAAIADPSCSVKNTNYGNNPEKCAPLTPFVKKRIDDDCELSRPIPLTENLGMVTPIDRLPGCNPITYAAAAPCTQGFEPRTMDNAGTYHIQSVSTGLYLTYNPQSRLVYANAPTSNPSYRQVWGVGQTIQSSEIEHHFSMQNRVELVSRGPSTWEFFQVEELGDGTIAIKNERHNKYLKVEPDFSLSGEANTITDASRFRLVKPDGGYVPSGLSLSS